MAELNVAELTRYVERLEEAEAEIRAATDIRRGILAEAKEDGWVPAALRQVVKERRMDPELRAVRNATLAGYREVLGLEGTPLGEAAMRSVFEFPKPFADQPIGQPHRRRPRKVLFDQEHPEGTA